MNDTDIETLIRVIVQPLVVHPEAVLVTVSETPRFEQYVLEVHPDDVGRIIGRRGHVAAAIRTIVYSTVNASSRKVRLVIDDHRNHETPTPS